MPIALVASAAVAMVRGEPLPWPAPATVIGHLFYLQELLGLPRYPDAYWTPTCQVLAYLVLCTGGAIVFWLVVEAPTHRWAQRYGRGRARAAAALPAE